jgi:single-stranded-DNA-specific exonuclease
MIESDGDLLKRKTTVLFNPEWHKGVIGIVASRLIEKYYRPTVLLTLSNGKATGSARSVKNFDIYEAIEECSDLLEQFGGHKHAAGLTLNPENIERFSRKFEEVVNDRIDEDMLVPEIEIDGVIKFSEITPRFYNIIRQFAPFGPGNMKPVFLTEQVVDKGYGKVVGNGHLKMNLMTSGDGLVSFPAIAFRQGERVKNILGRNPFSVCYSIEQDEWNGNKRLQLKVRDMKFT